MTYLQRSKFISPGTQMAFPAIVGLLFFVALPFGLALILSFYQYRIGSPQSPEWVGLRNFSRLFADDAFRRALVNNAVFALVVVPVQTTLALALALLLNQSFRGRTFFRTLFFLPVIFPMALVAIVWQLIFSPEATGLANSLLSTLTMGWWEPTDFLRDPRFALPAIMVMSIWQGCGFQMIILLAGRQGIPDHLYEAAEIDGANRWQCFLHITLPGLRNTLIFVVLVTTILAFRLFDQVYILTQGGPQNATTTVMFETVRAIFDRGQVGRGSAMTVVFFLIVVSIAMLQRKYLREERELS